MGVRVQHEAAPVGGWEHRTCTAQVVGDAVDQVAGWPGEGEVANGRVLLCARDGGHVGVQTRGG